MAPVGRMYFVPPSQTDRCFLRVLLTHVPGATSFEDLRTTHPPFTTTTTVHSTWKDACLARGLLDDDAEWDRCLAEAAGMHMPENLQHLFASLLAFNSVSNPLQLWNKYHVAFTEDFLHQARQVILASVVVLAPCPCS